MRKLSMFLMTFTFIILNYISAMAILDMDNTRINTDNSVQGQFDEAIAINYRNTNNMVTVWQDMRTGYQRVAVGHTFDGGQAWSDALLDLSSYPCQAFPSIAADTNGNYYICMIGRDSTGENPGDIIVINSTDGGITWSEPTVVAEGVAGTNDIMPKITVDNTIFASNGYIYVTWTRYTGYISTSHIFCSGSYDYGQTFHEPVQVSDGPGGQWPAVAVRSTYDNGDVYLTWYRPYPRGIYFDFSYSEAWDFPSADLRIASPRTPSVVINGGISVSPIPEMVCDNYVNSPGFMNVYIVFADSSDSDLDVFFETEDATPGYLHFTQPLRLNDDEPGNGTDQFMPTITVDNQGVIYVAFLDRRLDPNNLLYDVYYTSSSDLGVSWTPNTRVSNVSSDPTAGDIDGQIGNQIGITAWGGQVAITWTDTRDGNADVYASRLIATGITEPLVAIPQNISLDKPYPNPFNNSVEIKFSLASSQYIKLDVIDLLGRQITDLYDGICQAGSNSVIWNGKQTNGKDVSSGTYFVRLSVGGQTLLQKAVLLK